jgi:hypothetical protein
MISIRILIIALTLLAPSILTAPVPELQGLNGSPGSGITRGYKREAEPQLTWGGATGPVTITPRDEIDVQAREAHDPLGMTPCAPDAAAAPDAVVVDGGEYGHSYVPVRGSGDAVAGVA